jgi:hypothetical protein
MDEQFNGKSVVPNAREAYDAAISNLKWTCQERLYEQAHDD